MREPEYGEVSGSRFVHLELEEIADFCDGRLAAEDRGRITEHLVRCEECSDLVSEAAHIVEANGRSAEGVPAWGQVRSTAARWLPLAAAAVVLLGLGLAGSALYLQPQSFGVAELVGPLAGGREVVGRIWEGEGSPGAAATVTDAFEALQFLVGAHLVGFQTAVEAGDAAVAADAAQRVTIYVHQGVFLEAEDRTFRQAQIALESQKVPTRRYARLVEKVHGPIEEHFSGPHFELGKWAQAGYVAARTGSREWFERRKHRRFLSYLLRQDDEEIEPEARAALERIREVWDRGELGPAELAGLAGQFEAILQRYQALSEQDTLFSEE